MTTNTDLIPNMLDAVLTATTDDDLARAALARSGSRRKRGGRSNAPRSASGTSLSSGRTDFLTP